MKIVLAPPPTAADEMIGAMPSRSLANALSRSLRQGCRPVLFVCLFVVHRASCLQDCGLLDAVKKRS